MRATIVVLGQPYPIITDPTTGYYRFWLEEGSYILQVSEPGYVPQQAEVEITAGQGVTQNFTLIPFEAWLQVWPDFLQVTQPPGAITTQRLMLISGRITTIHYRLSIPPTLYSRIVSDGSWRASSDAIPGWETVGFDDSAWEYAIAPAPVNCGWDHCWDDPAVYTMWSEFQYQTIYLRKSFEIQDICLLAYATLLTRCDDDQDFYINGVLVASDWDGYAGPILDLDITAYLHTGVNVFAVKASDTFGGCRHECVDAHIYLGTPLPDWLTIDPLTGTLLANTFTSASIGFDATGLLPGVYTTTLDVESNDPYKSLIEIPVTMTVAIHLRNLYLPIAFRE
jgi:hypothetical protein